MVESVSKRILENSRFLALEKFSHLAEGPGRGGGVIDTRPLFWAKIQGIMTGLDPRIHLPLRVQRERIRQERQQQVRSNAEYIRRFGRTKPKLYGEQWNKPRPTRGHALQFHAMSFVVHRRNPYGRSGTLRRTPRVTRTIAAVRARRARRIRPAQRGFVRYGGNYGRYGGNRQELKVHGVSVDDAVVASAMAVSGSLLTIPEGNGEEQRVGRKINIKKISWRYTISLPTTATANDSSDIVRVMLVLDKQANGANATAGDVLATTDYQSFNQLANSMRFQVLMDKTYSIISGSGSGRGTTDTLSYGGAVLCAQWHKKCNIRIEYDTTATTGVITSIKSNNIFVILGSLRGAAGFESNMRFRFQD